MEKTEEKNDNEIVELKDGDLETITAGCTKQVFSKTNEADKLKTGGFAMAG